MEVFFQMIFSFQIFEVPSRSFTLPETKAARSEMQRRTFFWTQCINDYIYICRNTKFQHAFTPQVRFTQPLSCKLLTKPNKTRKFVHIRLSLTKLFHMMSREALDVAQMCFNSLFISGRVKFLSSWCWLNQPI